MIAPEGFCISTIPGAPCHGLRPDGQSPSGRPHPGSLVWPLSLLCHAVWFLMSWWLIMSCACSYATRLFVRPALVYSYLFLQYTMRLSFCLWFRIALRRIYNCVFAIVIALLLKKKKILFPSLYLFLNLSVITTQGSSDLPDLILRPLILCPVLTLAHTRTCTTLTGSYPTPCHGQLGILH